MPTKKLPGSKTPKKTHYTITEAAKKLGISRAAVHQSIRKGHLDAEWGETVQVIRRKSWKIPAAGLQKYRVSLSHQQAGKKN